MGGIGTFFERAEERWLEGISPPPRLKRRSFADEWRKIKPPEAAHFRLFVSDVPLEDVSWLYPSESLKIEVRIEDPTKGAGWKHSVSGSSIEIKTTLEGLTISALKAGKSCLVIESGPFLKKYLFEVSEPLAKDSLDKLGGPLEMLRESADSWTQDILTAFKQQLDALVSSEGFPQSFCDGLQEYHLALFHQSNEEARYTQRFERAAYLLTPFCEYSYHACLIVYYYFFRINQWDVFGRINHLPVLFSVGRFFRQPYTSAKQPPFPNAKGPAIAILDRDLELFQAINHYNGGALTEAIEVAQRALKSNKDLADDPQSDERFQLLLGRAFRKRRQTDEAGQWYSALLDSPDANWNKEARKFIENKDGRHKSI